MVNNPQNSASIAPTRTEIPVSSIRMPKVTPFIASNSASPAASFKFNLIGPFVCNFKDNTKQQDGVIYIKNKQIYAEFLNKKEQERVLIKGDCLYNWDQGETMGKQICKISPYMNLLEKLYQSGLASDKTLIDYLNQKDTQADASNQTIQCVEEPISDKLFTIPTQIKFVDTTFQEALQ